MTIEQIAGLIAAHAASTLNIRDDEGRKNAYEIALSTIMKEELTIVSPEGKLVRVEV